MRYPAIATLMLISSIGVASAQSYTPDSQRPTMPTDQPMADKGNTNQGSGSRALKPAAADEKPTKPQNSASAPSKPTKPQRSDGAPSEPKPQPK